MSDQNLRVAIDIGGTFTDLVAIGDNAHGVLEAKTPTTPADFATGVLNALTTGDVALSDVNQLIHGTTVVINAITERTGAKTALVTTKGFRDALAIGRGNRPDMYNLKFKKPEPFVPRRLRFEVSERVRPDGTVVQPVAIGELETIAAACRDMSVEALAICFLHSYAHPEHEREAAGHLQSFLPTVAITISSDITREWREYERSSTAVLNAYVLPRSRDYLEQLENQLIETGATGSRFVMTSNGGTATFGHARQQPIQLVESGPAGGVIGAQILGSSIGEQNIITLDIGGTTAKCSIIVDGHITIAGDYRLEWTPLSPGYPVRIPVIDIVEIGAGGGSIIWFDSAGALRIGPNSAGADPGPACYGLGGTDPTITDAMVLAGFIEPGPIPGSTIAIDRDLAVKAIQTVADRLGISIDEAASGVLSLFAALTVDALKLVSVRRGHDPSDFTLVAFGGGGPLHAARLGAELGVKRIIVPTMPATFSAWGMLHAQPRVDLTRTQVSRLDATTADARETTFQELERDASALLLSQSFAESQFLLPIRNLDMRYHGQEHTVRLLIEPKHADEEELHSEFNEMHKKLYRFALENTPVELVNYRVTTTAQLMSHDVVQSRQRQDYANPASTVRSVLTDDSGQRHNVQVFERVEIPSGFRADGPALVREDATTTLVPEGFMFETDGAGNLIITEL